MDINKPNPECLHKFIKVLEMLSKICHVHNRLILCMSDIIQLKVYAVLDDSVLEDFVNCQICGVNDSFLVFQVITFHQSWSILSQILNFKRT